MARQAGLCSRSPGRDWGLGTGRGLPAAEAIFLLWDAVLCYDFFVLFAIKVKREHNIAVFGPARSLRGDPWDDPDTAGQEHENKHEQHICSANSRRVLLTAYARFKILNIYDFSKKNASTSHMVTFWHWLGKRIVCKILLGRSSVKF